MTHRGSQERLFYTGMAEAILGAVLLGFARTFYLKAWFPEARHLAAPEPFFALHGVVFTGWFVLLVVQALLIARGTPRRHVRLGQATDAFLIPLLAWDVVSSRRLHSATLWGGLALVASQPLRLVVAETRAWQDFATWLLALPG